MQEACGECRRQEARGECRTRRSVASECRRRVASAGGVWRVQEARGKLNYRDLSDSDARGNFAARAGGRAAAGANYILANLKQGLSVPDWALAWSGNWNCHGHDSSRIGPAGSLAAGRGAR